MPIIKTYTSNEEAYRELKNVEYLQSSGTQYIDTKVLMNSSIQDRTRFEYEAKYINNNATYQANGLGSGASTGIYLGISKVNNVYIFQCNSVNGGAYDFNNFHTFIADALNGKVYFDDDEYTFVKLAGSGSATLKLFAYGTNSGGTTITYNKSQLKYCKIYDNNTLVRDYQPVVMNNVGYLYDKVEHKLYDNDGTGSFTYGHILDIEINPQDSGFVDRYYEDGRLNLLATPHEDYEFVNWLLKGYTRLEYIESTGTQYINTGIYPSQFTKAKFILKFTSISGTQGIMAIANATGSDVSKLSSDSGGKLFVRQANTSGTAENYLTSNTIYNIEWQRNSLASQPNKVILDGNEVISFTASANTDTPNRDYPLLALRIHQWCNN